MARSAKSSGTPAEGEREAITPDKVVDTAMEILERHGLRALSMRRLAAELGVQTPTVYWHVGNRDELLKRLIERLTEQLANVHPRGDTPAARLASILRSLLTEVRSRPHLIELSATQGRGEAIFVKAGELIAREITAAGLRGREAAFAYSAIIYNFGGFVLLENALRNDYRIRGASQWAHGDDIDQEMVTALRGHVDIDEIYRVSVEAMLTTLLPTAAVAIDGQRAGARRPAAARARTGTVGRG